MNLRAQEMFSRRAVDANTKVRLGVAVVIHDERGRILLEKRSDSSLWGFPGGRIEPGESVTEAAVREVREETGLDVEVTRLIGVYSELADRIVTYPDNIVHLVDILLEARIVAGRLSRSSESEAVQFFDTDALPRELVPPARLPVRDAVDGRIGVIR